MNPTITPRQPSRSAGLAIFLITVGTLAAIWAAVWYFYMKSRETPVDWAYFVCAGTFFSGMALVVIGGLVGYIGRSARHADNPTPAAAVPAVPAGTVPAGTVPAVTTPAGAPVVTATPPAPAAAPRVAVPSQAQKS